MVRLILLCAAASLGILISAGCPPEPPTETTDPGDLTPRVSATVSVNVGELATLTAQLPEGTDPTSVAYRWFQTYGRPVELKDPNTASASFEAPSLFKEQTLSFRVDVQTADGTIYSATVEVVVAADPDFGLDESTEEEDSADEDPHPRVRLRTSMGSIVLELDRANAPLTVNNFLRYVDDGFYDGTIIHRVEPDFVIQGGGFEPGLVEKDTRSPITNESDNGLKNERGTVATARSNDPDSATSQFYINLVDNESLDATSGADGYAVFGRVISGMDVVDSIAEVETESRDSPTSGRLRNVPVEDVVLMNAVVVSSGG